jgi:hypothetical protein
VIEINIPTELAQAHFMQSSFREKTLEHIFVGECLRRLWIKGVRSAEVLRADVDGAGYDLVMDVNNVLRHIQLKASFNGSRTGSQAVNAKLCTKPSGCVIWVGFDPGEMVLGPFLWFGAGPNQPLPSLSGFKKAKHTKADSKGFKSERQSTWIIPKARFEPLPTMAELIEHLFGNFG